MGAMLGALFAVLVGLLAVPAYIHYESEGVNNVRIVTTAQEMQVMAQAATSYIQANYNNMTLPTDLTVSELQQAQYLPNSFSPINPYGQTWQVQVVAPSTSQAGLVEALVTTSGGNPISEKEAPEIAAQAGAQGGFVPYPGQYGSGTSNNVAMGAYGGWQVPLTSPLANPGSGHLIALLYFNNGTLENDYLYRVAVPGQPQLNSMATALNMSANDIAQANVAQAQGANLGMDNGTAVVGSACSTNGAIAAVAPTASATSTPGNLVNCVNHVWTTLGGSGNFVALGYNAETGGPINVPMFYFYDPSTASAFVTFSVYYYDGVNGGVARMPNMPTNGNVLCEYYSIGGSYTPEYAVVITPSNGGIFLQTYEYNTSPWPPNQPAISSAKQFYKFGTYTYLYPTWYYGSGGYTVNNYYIYSGSLSAIDTWAYPYNGSSYNYLSAPGQDSTSLNTNSSVSYLNIPGLILSPTYETSTSGDQVIVYQSSSVQSCLGQNP
jgi:hypothetical protein